MGERCERPRWRRDNDGKLTGTRDGEPTGCGSFGMRETVEPRRVISGVFATYEGNTKLSSPQTTHCLSRRHPTARTRQPATDGGRADRADKARIRVRLLACCAVAAIPPAP